METHSQNKTMYRTDRKLHVILFLLDFLNEDILVWYKQSHGMKRLCLTLSRSFERNLAYVRSSCELFSARRLHTVAFVAHLAAFWNFPYQTPRCFKLNWNFPRFSLYPGWHCPLFLFFSAAECSLNLFYFGICLSAIALPEFCLLSYNFYLATLTALFPFTDGYNTAQSETFRAIK